MSPELLELRLKREDIETKVEKVARSVSSDMLAGYLIVAVFEVAEQIALLRESLESPAEAKR